MDAAQLLALNLDPTLILKAKGMTADAWQREILFSTDRQILLNCSRGAGKSETVSALALHTALFRPKALVLLISRAQRQAHELFRKVIEGYNALGRPIKMATDNASLSKLELVNGSRIIGLPGKEENIRAFQGVNLLVIDEAAKVPDDLYYTVRPMTRTSRGRIVCLSTPFGKRGFFWREWEQNKEDWKKIRATWRDCPRISADDIEKDRRSMGDSWVKQEYECSFEAMEGLVYPDFADKCEWTVGLAPRGKPVGGIDFGWRNPFAAIWGVLDEKDVLWIYGERYLRECPLHEHVKALRGVSTPSGRMWYADPAGRTEIEEMRSAGLTVRKGNNDIKLGIAAVTARLRTDRLRVHFPSCLNLLEEAKLYRYPRVDERAKLGENPIDEHNHALAALRYLVSKLDTKFIARLRKTLPQDGPEEQAETQEEMRDRVHSTFGVRPWLRLDNDELFENLN